MNMIKIPVNGMKDIMPNEMIIRVSLLEKMRLVYKSFGYIEIETPVIEHIENLLSEQGWENEKLIFKILKRGEKLNKSIDSFDEKNLVDLGSRYDLTLPLYRYYSNNKDKLPMPFKSMQIGNVFRADRPQKGRYRQFMQCDIDIFGEKTNIAEIDLLLATTKYLNQINFDKYNFYYEINDRRILKSIQEICGFNKDDFDNICIILDKLDKVGKDKMSDMLLEQGMSIDSINKYNELIEQMNVNFDLNNMKQIFKDNIEDNVLESLNEIINIVSNVTNVRIKFNPNLVRGMGYYTGCIFEIKSEFFNGSIGGGGRYDKMTSKFIGDEISACGISIGFERILAILMESDIKNNDINKSNIIYGVNKDIDYISKYNMFKDAYDLRNEDNIVNIISNNKNKKFQRESFEQLGYNEFKDF